MPTPPSLVSTPVAEIPPRWIGYSCSHASDHHGPSRGTAILLGLYSGVAQLAEQGTVNAKVVGSSPTPGATAISQDIPDAVRTEGAYLVLDVQHVHLVWLWCWSPVAVAVYSSCDSATTTWAVDAGVERKPVLGVRPPGVMNPPATSMAGRRWTRD